MSKAKLPVPKSAVDCATVKLTALYAPLDERIVAAMVCGVDGQYHAPQRASVVDGKKTPFDPLSMKLDPYWLPSNFVVT